MFCLEVYCLTAARYVLPVLAIWILLRCVRSMLREKYEPEVWGYLRMTDGSYCPLRHWELTIGRSRFSDVVLGYPQVSRSHAAMVRDSSGAWVVYDLGSTGGTKAGGLVVDPAGVEIADGDIIELADVKLKFVDLTEGERQDLAGQRTEPGKWIRPESTFVILTLFQAVLAMEHSFTAKSEYIAPIALAFACVCLAQWAYYFIMRSMNRNGFEAETLAFFLSTVGLSVAASSVPGAMIKQIILLLAGLGLFVLLGWWLRELERAKKLRWLAGAAALGFLALNLLVSKELFGAKNWIEIGGFSLQPSEFVKIAYIYAGAASLDRLFTQRNLFMFIGFSAVCVGALALMGDFGTALVFFITFLVISFMRSGNLATVFLAVAGAGLAGFMALTVKPYIAQRFATWGHVWEYANDGGYQQTRALSAAASGGLFGQGAGSGWLKDIVAADTDLVFCVVCEELGLIVAVCAMAAILLLAFFVVRSAAQGRSSYYVIAACAAVSMMMAQMCLNVFGSVDILPFTGVTVPFVSRGGSSLICCWALLAFIKAADTRQNASFVVKNPGHFRDRWAQEPEEDEA